MFEVYLDLIIGNDDVLQCSVPSGLMTQGGNGDHFCMTHSCYQASAKEK